MKALAPTQPSLTPLQWRIMPLPYSLANVSLKVLGPHLAFIGEGECEAIVFSIVFGWSREAVV